LRLLDHCLRLLDHCLRLLDHRLHLLDHRLHRRTELPTDRQGVGVDAQVATVSG
jgi:hypothetical protein